MRLGSSLCHVRHGKYHFLELEVFLQVVSRHCRSKLQRKCTTREEITCLFICDSDAETLKLPRNRPGSGFELQSLAPLNNPFKTCPQKLTPSLKPYVPLLFYGTGLRKAAVRRDPHITLLTTGAAADLIYYIILKFRDGQME